MRTQSQSCLHYGHFLSYSVSILDVPGANGVFPTAINDSDQVVGHYTVPNGQGPVITHGVVFKDGSFTAVDTPGTSTGGTALYDVNDKGVALGSGPGLGAFTYNIASGTFQSVTLPSTDAEGNGVLNNGAYVINDNGDIFGSYAAVPLGAGATGPSLNRDYIFDPGTGAFTTVLPPGALESGGFSLNNNGQVFGEYTDNSFTPHLFLYDSSSGQYTLFDVPGRTDSVITGNDSINDAGAVTGTYTNNAGVQLGFLYSHGTFTNIAVPGATETQALDINNLGEIVGTDVDSQGIEHAFVYAGGTFNNIDIPGASGAPNSIQISGINNQGDIVGTADGMAFLATAKPSGLDFGLHQDLGKHVEKFSHGFSSAGASALARIGASWSDSASLFPLHSHS